MARFRPLPPISELRRRLAYRSDGALIWKRPLGGRVKPGYSAGFINKHNGYVYIGYNSQNFKFHRVVWAIVKQEDPLSAEIDHINGNKLDNKIQNLRKANKSQNQHNQKRAKGYYFHKRDKKWAACIKVNGKAKFIGTFDTEQQAREAYLRAKEKLHGEFMPTDMKHELGQIDGPTSQLNFFDD